MGYIVTKVNDVRLNRRFVETDDEEEACRLLFSAYYKTVFDAVDRMRWNYSDTVVDPDDITGETFTKAFNKWKEIQEPEKLVEWLVTAAKNLMIDKIRKANTKTRRLPSTSLDGLSVSEREAYYASMCAETDAEYAEADRAQVEQLLRLLEGKDREIVAFMRDGLSQKEIAAEIEATPGAVEKRWKRLKMWAAPILHHLDALIDCLPEENDRNVMERYLDGQSFSEITEALGISCSTIEETVKRVIADWKKAVRQSPTDPVSAMVKKRR